MALGWRFGSKTCPKAKTHRLLKHYIYMTVEEQDNDREAAYTIITSLYTIGYILCKKKSETHF
eukprot:TRINITY_DN6775_c0_g1_i1.p1 TRINITY_DN6775_c0_g1~~TRINITY_DN6775_c0_g1_i1.p1  ORF type:complete len:63 (-),score=1.01 TRINITY_DN6775_c0_g1_i1:112-300(-)